MGITKLAIERPVFILMVMVLIVMIGIMGYRSMRLEENPDVSFGMITVSTSYPGAGAEEVNNLLSREIEESISGVADLVEVTSTSQEGVSVVVLQFEVGTDMDVALNDVRSKVDTILGELPDAALKPVIEKIDTTSEPILYFTIKSDTHNNRDLRDLAENVLKDRFARIPGIASVGVDGGDVREIQIQIKKDALIRYGIGILDVQQAVVAASLNVPSGRITSGAQEFTVRVIGEFQTPDDIGEMYLTISESGPDGATRKIQLKDVATVVDANAERRTYARLDGSDSVTIVVQKAKQGNAVEIANAIRRTPVAGFPNMLAQMEDEHDVEFVVTRDLGVNIKDSLFDLQFALFFGIVLVTGVVYLFLHNVRGMLIVAIAIPLCIFGTLIVLWATGFTINNMTMLALSLAVGVLVDDAIVVIENIYRHLAMGEEPVEAAINGRMEIGLAAIAITLADVVVFVPIAFMGGIVGQFFKPLAIAFAVTVLFSLFVSFTVTPMLASRWYRKDEDWEHPKGPFAEWFERGFGNFKDGYGRALKWSLNHRWYLFGGGFAALISVFLLISTSGMKSPGDVFGSMFLMVLFAISIVLAIAVFTITFLRNVWSLKRRRTVFVGSMVALALACVVILPMLPDEVKSKIPFHIADMQLPALAIIGLVLGWLVALVATFLYALIANFRPRHARYTTLVSGLGFVSAFALVAVGGQQFGAWKDESVFKFAFMPPTDGGQVEIGIELPPGSTLAETEAVVAYVEQIAMQHPEAEYVTSGVGRQSGGGFSVGSTGTNYGRISVNLYGKKSIIDSLMFWKESDERLRTVSDTSVGGELLQQIGRYPGAKITVAASSGQAFGRPIQMSFRSNDGEALIGTATDIRDRLARGEIDGVVSPDMSSKPGKPEFQVLPRRARMGDADITVAELGAAMRVLYEGDDQAKLRVLGREYDIRVMLDVEDRNDVNVLQQVPIRFSDGRPIYLSEVATIRRAQGVDKIDRRDRVREVQVSADLLPGFAAGTVQRDIDIWMEEQGLIRDGVEYKPLGQADIQAREMGYLFGALGLGIVLVYMLLASLYDNLMYPFIIQLAQPQALVGAILALIITGKTLNIVGMIGIIALVGLVGKNAILLVDYTNTLRARGLERFDALVEAGRTRLRPIMMTTLALIFGMLPVALAIGRGSEFRETIGITIIGGVALSTVLTLLIIPCSYSIFDDLSEKIRGRMRRDEPGGPPDRGTHAPDLESEAQAASGVEG
ncbi:MAG: efflux RND transporter permease subunit [Armatimonadetes bacterium]|nr:efflux RND transporter permease subunit [Armatimonadota bacterium]